MKKYTTCCGSTPVETGKKRRGKKEIVCKNCRRQVYLLNPSTYGVHKNPYG